MTLNEIVARALRRGGIKADERDAADLIDALRDPPPGVIEAGAKAITDKRYGEGAWALANNAMRFNAEEEFEAAWRAALNAEEWRK